MPFYNSFHNERKYNNPKKPCQFRPCTLDSEPSPDDPVAFSQSYIPCGENTSLHSKGLVSYCKAETTFTFHFSILTLSNASLGINNREIKSESGISFAIASQPLKHVGADLDLLK